MRHPRHDRPGLADRLDELIHVLPRVQMKPAARAFGQAVQEGGAVHVNGTSRAFRSVTAAKDNYDSVRVARHAETPVEPTGVSRVRMRKGGG